MVRWARLELARVAPPPPQDGVSTIPPPAQALGKKPKDKLLISLKMGLHKAKLMQQQAYK